jgi:hypothetical protein
MTIPANFGIFLRKFSKSWKGLIKTFPASQLVHDVELISNALLSPVLQSLHLDAPVELLNFPGAHP